MKYEAVIGLEVHVQLNTKTKIFCNCTTEYSGKEPNTCVCEICSAQPGVLPVLNKQVLEHAVKAGLALNCNIAAKTKFDRKNYFYPDLPKGYQISQFDMPICEKGSLKVLVPTEVENEYYEKEIGITRIHMEEDAGKNIHGGSGEKSYVDLNRAGVPLLEIVSEPDMRTPAEAREYLEKLKIILKYINISDCNMEDGSLRCDANISIRPVGEKKFGTKAEIKNMNSFRGVQKALEYEIKRQTEVLERGEKVIQETRLYDEAKGVTATMRKKEGAVDYRYFPEPDLPPFNVSREFIEKIRTLLPEMPDIKFKRYTAEYGLPNYDANLIANNPSLAVFFEECIKNYKNYKAVANWLMGEVARLMNEAAVNDISKTKITPVNLVEMLKLIDNSTISGKIAKTVIAEIFNSGEAPSEIIKKLGLVQISDDSVIISIINEVLKENEKVVADYVSGKDAAKGFLVGQAMKKSKGKANPKMVNEVLEKELLKLRK
ncbi:MAG: Asp-tRNA(Asn)/Glu-tRNA(Gln) amidotransferase subunit GatB [Candidatus Wallbacteria bacterium]